MVGMDPALHLLPTTLWNITSLFFTITKLMWFVCLPRLMCWWMGFLGGNQKWSLVGNEEVLERAAL